jgi:hypothetical protein
MAALAQPAAAVTREVYHWDLFEHYTNYAYYGAGDHPCDRHRWSVDTAHSTTVRQIGAYDATVYGVVRIPAHSQSYHYFDYCHFEPWGKFLNGRSERTILYNRNGYMLD